MEGCVAAANNNKRADNRQRDKLGIFPVVVVVVVLLLPFFSYFYYLFVNAYSYICSQLEGGLFRSIPSCRRTCLAV